MRFIIRTSIVAFTLLLISQVVPGIEVDGVVPALIAAIFLGVLNALVRPVLIFLTLPITIVTLGLFIFVINAGLFLLVARFVDGFAVSSFWIALFGSIVVSVVSAAVNKVID